MGCKVVMELGGRGRVGIGIQGNAGQEGVVLTEALEKLPEHLLILCMDQAAVARIRHIQA